MSEAYSVVIPAYNAAATLPQTVDSILAQTVPAQKIIVADDGSTDGTASIARKLPGPVTVVVQANRGPGAATTAGFSKVSTPWVATLDSDDVWLPQKIERQLAVSASQPDVAGIFSLARLFDDARSLIPMGPVRFVASGHEPRCCFAPSRPVRSATTDFPGQLGEVIDWLSRSRDLGHKHIMVEEILAMRRVRPGSLSSRLDADRSRGYLVAIHNAIERRKRMADKGNAGSGS